MIKYFCDRCECEIVGKGANAVADRITAKAGRVKVEVQVGVGDTWNSGHACRQCVFEVLALTARAEGYIEEIDA